MSRLPDLDEEYTPVTRLQRGFALRDLIAGAEFEIREDSCQDVDEEEYFNSSKFSANEVESYINMSALDLETDESENVVSFPELRQKMVSLTSDNKVMKLVKRPGAGSIVRPDSVVFIHYSAHVNLDEIPYDNTYLRRGRPERKRLGIGELVIGLELGINSMKKGEKAQFLIEPDYAYGKLGCPPRIPPDATVLFEVELINFTDCVAPENPEFLENVDRKSFVRVLKDAKDYHKLGNEEFKHNNEKAAIMRYKKAVDIILSCHMNDEEEELQQKKMLLKLYTNLSVCYNKCNKPERVCIVAKEAMYIDEENAKKNAKLLYNLGFALITLNEFRRSAHYLRTALRLEPNNQAIKDAISKLELKRNKAHEDEKICFRKALGALGVQHNEDKDVPDAETNLGAVNEELVNQVKKKINDAKTGKTVKINLLPEVISRVEELCKSLISEEDSLLVTKVNTTTIVISKDENNVMNLLNP